MEFVNLVEICLWPHLALKGLFNNLYYTEAMACEALYFDFSPPPISISITPKYTAIRERSENVHATIPKGIMGGFEWRERMARRPRTNVCECIRKATKVGSTATVVRNRVS